MNDVKELLEKNIGGIIRSIEQPRERRTYLFVDCENVQEAARYIFFDLGCRLCTATAVEVPEGVEIIYHFYQDAMRMMVNLKTLAKKPDLIVPSVGKLFKAAEWIEREMAEMFGVTFEGHPDPRRLLLADDWPEAVYPFRKDFEPADADSRVGFKPFDQP